MKFRCERDALVEALGTAGRAVSGRGGMLPVLSGVRAELLGDTLTLTGSDLDLTITIGTSVNGQADGATVLPAKLANDVVRALPSGAVTVEVADDADGGSEARITADRAEFTLRVTSAEEYPKLPVTDADPVQLDAAEFARALHQVTPAASTDDNRPIITGVLVAAEEGGLRLVATDSYRLAVRDLAGVTVPLGERSNVLVPSRALREVERQLSAAKDSITLRLGERDAAFEVGTTRITTRLIEGEFPNYRGLIPSSYPNRLVVGREHQPRQITPQVVLEVSAKLFGIDVEDLTGKARTRDLVDARHIAMYVCRQLTNPALSFPQIAKAFGGRDHTTVMNAVQRIERDMKERRKTFDRVNELSSLVRNGE